MTKTTAELRESVAKKIGVLSVDQDLDAEDAAAIDARIGEVTDYLRELGLIWWADDAIPAGAFMPMTLMVAAVACGEFGKVNMGLESGYGDGKSQLSAIKPSAANKTTQADYF